MDDKMHNKELLDQGSDSVKISGLSKSRTSRRNFIRLGAAATGGVVASMYVKPGFQSIKVPQAFAAGSGINTYSGHINLLQSPGFEGENAAADWEGSSRGGRHIIVTEGAHGGARVQQTVGHSSYIRQVFQTMGVAEGTTYYAAGWVKTNELQGDGASIRLVWFDGEGQVIRIDILGSLSGTNDWIRFEGAFVAPAGAATVWFNLFTGFGAGGTAWFDDNEFFVD